MKNIRSSEMEEFKKNYKQRIENLSKSKTEWIKDFVELHKSKPKVKTVGELYKELNGKSLF